MIRRPPRSTHCISSAASDVYKRQVVGDVLKLQRNMVFVTQEKVNLFDYLAGTRVRTEQCEDCVFSVACDGFYSFDETFD